MYDLGMVYLTGFRTFLNHGTNPTELLVRTLVEQGFTGRILDVTYAEVESFVSEMNAELFYVFFGLNAKAQRVRIERFAYNAYGGVHPDNDGVLRKGSIIPAGEERLSTNVDVDGLVGALNAQGLDVEASDDPGRYLCNFLYFLGLRKSGGRALFVHVPLLSDFFSSEELLKVAKAIVNQLD